ncbi:MAG TPA: DUF2652 domain-containing protein [Telmatospirillum sp.]|nr:DUF2652 domain-containing protein [Telmatospirillum sp.]
MSERNETDAHILLADISGYTRFLRENRVTLRHANYIVSELLAAIMQRAEPVICPEKIEGDAILFVAPAGQVIDASVRRSMFGFFSAFYRRRAQLIAHNSCPCEACTTIHHLDLKVISHFGKVLRYTVNNFEELAGFDIIVAHRLLKNSVEATRYLMVTDAAWALVRPENHALPVESHVEQCEGVGDISVVVIRGEVTLPDEQPGPPPKTSMTYRIGDFAIKHLMLLPFGERLFRQNARGVRAKARHFAP